MKIRFYTAFLIVVLALSLLAGCGIQRMHLPLLAQPNGTYRREIPEESVPLASTPEATPETSRVLTEEEVMAIALAHAGISAEQAHFFRVEPELRDRIPHFDVEFEAGRWEYEYEIHAETGAILSFDRDD